MIAHLLEPQTAPFAVALGVMLLIALMEGVGLLFGFALSGLVDAVLPDFDVPDVDLPDVDVPDVDVDVDAGVDVHAPDIDAPAVASGGAFTQFLGWLCFGRVPALVLLVAFLTAFGLFGLILQSLVKGMAGAYLPALVASVPVFAAALPATRYLGLGLSKIMPKEESEAVSQENFIGKIAVVTTGVAKRGLPAQAKLQDHYGQTHYVLAEPDLDDETFEAGSEVLLVRRTGSTFRVIANRHAALSKSNRVENQ